LKPIPLDPNEELVKISAIPNWAQSAFKEVIQLNRVQSKFMKLLSLSLIVFCFVPQLVLESPALLFLLSFNGLHVIGILLMVLLTTVHTKFCIWYMPKPLWLKWLEI
jgi:hypothetical protein